MRALSPTPLKIVRIVCQECVWLPALPIGGMGVAELAGSRSLGNTKLLERPEMPSVEFLPLVPAHCWQVSSPQ